MAVPAIAWPIAAVLAKIAEWLSKKAVEQGAMFLSFKIFMTTLFVVVLPLVLNNLLVKILMAIHDKAMSLVTGGAQSYVMQLTGLAAYLADLLNLPLCVSILLGAVATRFSLKLLRIF